MKQETKQKCNSSPILEKIGAGERRKYSSFDMGDEDFEGIVACENCDSQRVQILSHPPARTVRCRECGHDEWN